MYLKEIMRKRRSGYRNCKTCGKNYLFVSGQHNGESTKFCSKECAKIDARKRTLKFIYNHPEISKRAREKLKLKVLIHYGGDPPKCACCGELQYEFLCVDHIEGGGSGNRQQIELREKGISFHRWIVNNNFPKGLQILCYNCNIAKRDSNVQYCPVHHPELYDNTF